jgi:secondary thiamine-phosphate synthase enzyme
MGGDKNMTVVTKDITFQTKGNCDIIDITSQVAKNVQESGVSSGIVTLFISGSTAGITTIEYEPRLLGDFKNMWGRVVPQDIPYEHNKTWGDGNGHSHVRASMLGPSLTVPFVNKRLTLGTWQQIVLLILITAPGHARWYSRLWVNNQKPGK